MATLREGQATSATSLNTAVDRADPVEIVDTTELRWFFAERLPGDIALWFMDSGATGLFEERRDTYLMESRVDRGIKQRFGHTLELKERQSAPEEFTLAGGLVGSLEVWRRWSPAHDVFSIPPQPTWVHTHKSVVKRRFTTGGDEIQLTGATRPMTGAGCDVEIVGLTAQGREYWSFAFAAFGPADGHRDSISESWRALCAEGSCPRPGRLFSPSCGYPEWLTLNH